MNRLSIALLLVCSVAAAKEAPPPPGPQKPFKLPPLQTFKLENGMQVTLVPYGNLPRARIALVVRAGNANATDKQRYVPNLLAEYLKNGTESRDAEAVARAASSMGGDLAIGAGMLSIDVESPVLAEKTADMVRLVAEVMLHPALPASELERLQTDLIRLVAVQRGQPQVLVGESFRALLFPHHPYGLGRPTPEEIKSYTVEDVRAFWQSQLGAARAHLYVVGKFDAAAVESAVREAFASWKPGKPPSVPPVKPVTAKVLHLVDRPKAVQSSVLIGLPTVDPSQKDYLALTIANSLLGGSFTSRITSNIREDKGYTYSPHSFVAPLVGGGSWGEQADVKSDTTGASLTEIVKEIDRLGKEAPPKAELENVEREVAGNFVVDMASLDGIVNQLEFVDVYGLGADYLEKYVDRVFAVTPAEVQRLARKYLPSGKMTIVVVGDRETVEKQLAPFGRVVLEPAAK